MAANYLEQSLAKLKQFEGSVPWMYRDTVGRITVGVGLMLPNSRAAESLPFLVSSRPATAQEISVEFARVDALPFGRVPAFYRSDHLVQLTQQTIDAKLYTVLKSFDTDLRSHFPLYDSFPASVKMALLDMIYNLGPEGLFRGFPHLIAAVRAGAWAQAAERCLRSGPGPARNAWTRQQFLDAVVDTIKAEAESVWTRIARWMRLIFSSRSPFGK